MVLTENPPLATVNTHPAQNLFRSLGIDQMTVGQFEQRQEELLELIRRKIADERLVTLVARALKAGIVVDGEYQKTTKGCPQESPLSPMLSNIVLNELDWELERRGHRYCRWADDFLVLLKSERAAKRVMVGIAKYLEEQIGLPVNRDKSQVAPVKGVAFVGFQILMGKIRVSKKARVKFKNRVRELTKRNNPLSMHQIIEQLNEYLRGWVSYFGIQEFRMLSMTGER